MDCSTNESDVRLAEVLQNNTEDRLKICEQKITQLNHEKADMYKNVKQLEQEKNEFKTENGTLKDLNKQLEER